jgi:branched-chain amino acid transport system substrate-binding protein
MKQLRLGVLATALATAFLANTAWADIKVGVILPTTGPAAAYGIQEKNAISLGPTTVGGQKVEYIMLDDRTDPTEAVKNAKKLTDEEKVDIVIGAGTTPTGLAIIDPLVESKTPLITLAPSKDMVSPMNDKRRWIFKTTTNDDLECEVLFKGMKERGVKRIGFIGYSDSYGTQWAAIAKEAAKRHGIEVTSDQYYARADTNVSGQVLRILTTKPDAILVVGTGAGAATPLIELKNRNFRGGLYFTLGAVSPDFVRIAGATGSEGVYVPFAAVMGVDQVPKNYPARDSAASFVSAYEAKFGKDTGTIYSAQAWDAVWLFKRAAEVALKDAKPGTPEFREKLRTALENTKDFPLARGVFTYSPTDHAGLDASALFLGRYAGGKVKIVTSAGNSK